MNYCLPFPQYGPTSNGYIEIIASIEKYSVTRNKPKSDEWTYVGKMTTSRRYFGLLEVVNGMYLLGGVHPESSDKVTANEVCTIVDTDTVECEVVGDESELGLIGHLGQKHFQKAVRV